MIRRREIFRVQVLFLRLTVQIIPLSIEYIQSFCGDQSVWSEKLKFYVSKVTHFSPQTKTNHFCQICSPIFHSGF